MRPMGCGSTGGHGRRETMTTGNESDSTAIDEIIQGLDPVDWTQLRLLADTLAGPAILEYIRVRLPLPRACWHKCQQIHG